MSTPSKNKELSGFELALSKVPNKCNNVVFPAPEGPTIATISCSATTRLTESKTFRVPKFLDGVDITQLSDKAIAQFRNQKMGFIFQFHELLPEFTALENVCLPTWLGGESQKNAAPKAMELLERLGVGNRASHKPAALSGGEQQRVAVARALINDPKIIFADEPSGNLDSENAEQLHNLFFELKAERGCSFVIVTHNKDLAKRADRTISLKDGKID